MGVGLRAIKTSTDFSDDQKSGNLETESYLLVLQSALFTSENRENRWFVFGGGGNTEYSISFNASAIDKVFNGTSAIWGTYIDFGGKYSGIRLTYFSLAAEPEEFGFGGTEQTADLSGSGLSFEIRWLF